VNPRGAEVRIRDILTAIEAIQRIEEAQLEADIAGAAVQFHLVVIGEAIRNIDPDRRAQVAFPWEAAIGLRNRIAHEYFRVDRAVLAETLREPLADLRLACLTLLAPERPDDVGTP